MLRTKKSPKFYLALVIFSLVGQIAWVVENMYFNVFIYKMFNASAGAISAMVAASSVAATVTTLLIGALSDKLGKRKIFICGGYILWGISIWSFALIRTDVINALFPAAVSAASVGVSLVIVMDCIMTFFGSAANDACFNAWLTDSTDETNRGSVEGINAMMPLMAILVVFGGFMGFDQDQSSTWTVIFGIIGSVVVILGIAGFFLIEESKVDASANQKYFANIFYGFRGDVIRSNRKLYLTLIAYAVFGISIQIFMPYLILYYEKSLGMTDYVLIFAPAIILAAAFTAFYGRIYDKKGFLPSLIPALALLMAGYTVLYFCRSTVPVFLGTLIMLSGYLAGMAVFGAMIRDNTPENKAGMFQGLRIVGQVLIPGIIGPMIGAAVLKNAETIVNSDGTESFLPNENIFLAAFAAALILLPLLPLLRKRKEEMMPEKLTTPAGEALTGAPWETYPRPLLKRDSYVNLNGEWELAVAKTPTAFAAYNRKIRVPFAPESQLSGIGEHFEEGSSLFYRRNFTLPEGFKKDRVLLHFGAVDQFAEVYVNQTRVGNHLGGYESFCFDITDALEEENELVVRCTDDLRDKSQPYGKQVVSRGGMWYTPVSGIWQTVWLESVAKNYVNQIDIQVTLDTATVTVSPAMDGKILCQGREYPLTAGIAQITPEKPIPWTPENPKLYAFTVEAGEDRFQSYFALRTLEIKEVNGLKRLCLNGDPYFFHGLLDQGYWPDGLFTPASPKCYEEDILAMKSLGFNMLRKHIKVEPEQFYYDCDRLGMVVFQDMVNNGAYSFLKDTILPTFFSQHKDDKNAHRDEKTRKAFLAGMEATVRQLKNHPCICCWTIFNEGWGQFDGTAAYRRLKELDSSRFIDTTSGWFRGSETDVESLHIYFGMWHRLKKSDKPIVLSEFGGFTYSEPGHIFNPHKSYGYGTCKTKEALTARLQEVYEKRVIPAISKGLCASIYTQVSDVEDEINGILTYDRKISKPEKETMLSIARKLADGIK